MPRNIDHTAGVPNSEPRESGADTVNRRLSMRLEIDAAYDNSAAFPDVPEWRERWRQRSQAVAVVAPARIDLAYGSAPSQRLDIFPYADPDAATAVFVHGGFWSRQSKEVFRFLVRGIHAAGLNAVFVGHTLAPNARIDQIVEELRSATHWTFAHLGELDFAARPLIIVGWSSGAHLAAMVMDEACVGAGMGISGVYDLEPMRHASINDVLKLDRDEALRNSPTFSLPSASGPFLVTYGQRELPAFRSQSERFYAARTAAGLPGEILALPGHHHHSVLDELYEPDGQLTRVLKDLAART